MGIVGGELVKGPFSGLLAVIFLLASGFCIWKFSTTPNASTLLLVAGIVCAILMVVLGVMFMSGRVNKTEEIHITE